MLDTVFTKNINTKKKYSNFEILWKLFSNIAAKNKRLFFLGSFFSLATAIINFNISNNMKNALVFSKTNEEHIGKAGYKFSIYL